MRAQQIEHVPVKGKVVIVTGASSGIGWHTAKLFAREGAKVVVTARRKERLTHLVSEIAAEGGEAVGIAGDAALEATAVACVDAALTRWVRFDILVANAGQGNYASITDTTLERYDEMMAANVRSTFVFSQAAARHMKAERSGIIVIISSIAGLQGFANETVYSATKFAQVGFGQALDLELAPHGVQVTVMCPGGTRTEFALDRGRTAESIAGSKTYMEPWEFADSILYACTLPPHMRILQMKIRHIGPRA